MASHIIWRATTLASYFIHATGLVAAVFQEGSDLDLGDVENNSLSSAWCPAVPGTQPLLRSLNHSGIIDRRACSADGSSFCFADETKFCAGCGICCGGSSDYCCAADQLCCGTACCAAGQTCVDGKCYLSAETSTVTRTTTVTAAPLVATKVVTVVEIIEETSTVISTVEVTVSSAATETDVIYVTTTAHAERAVELGANLGHLGLREEPPTLSAVPLAVEWLRLDTGDASSNGRRQVEEIEAAAATPAVAETPAAAAASSTSSTSAAAEAVAKQSNAVLTKSAAVPITSTTVVTVMVTQEHDLTSVISATVTSQTTTLILTTIFQTDTKVLQAQKTILVTSTIAVTSHKPTTRSSTTTSTASPPKTSTTESTGPTDSVDPNATPLSSHTPPKLKLGVIIGIAVAGIVSLIIIAVLAFLCWRRRRAARKVLAEARHYLESDIPKDPRRATLPRLSIPWSPHRPQQPFASSPVYGDAAQTQPLTLREAYHPPRQSSASFSSQQQASTRRLFADSPGGWSAAGSNRYGSSLNSPGAEAGPAELPDNQVGRVAGNNSTRAVPVNQQPEVQTQTVQRAGAGRARPRGNQETREIYASQSGSPNRQQQHPSFAGVDPRRQMNLHQQQHQDTRTRYRGRSPAVQFDSSVRPSRLCRLLEPSPADIRRSLTLPQHQYAGPRATDTGRLMNLERPRNTFGETANAERENGNGEGGLERPSVVRRSDPTASSHSF